MARRTGTPPNGIRPPFFYFYSFSPSSKRIGNGSGPPADNRLINKGSRSQIPVNERRLTLSMNLIFFPLDGLVFDSYAGRCSVAIAPLKTGRWVIVVEEDSFCSGSAAERLKNVTTVISEHQRT